MDNACAHVLSLFLISHHPTRLGQCSWKFLVDSVTEPPVISASLFSYFYATTLFRCLCFVSNRTGENARSAPLGERKNHLHLAGHTRVSRGHTEHVIGVAGRLMRRLQGRIHRIQIQIFVKTTNVTASPASMFLSSHLSVLFITMVHRD
jgi:hypothetical protein